MSRKCSCCGRVGHNVSKCDDERANALMHQLFQISPHRIGTQIIMAKSLPAEVVPFVLSRGFGVAIPSSGKRNLLIELIMARASSPAAAEAAGMTVEDLTAVAAEHAEEVRSRLLLQETMRAQAAFREQSNAAAASRRAAVAVQTVVPDIMLLLDECLQTFSEFPYYGNTITVLPGHSIYIEETHLNPRTTMLNIVVKFLNTMYRLESDAAADLPASVRQDFINVRLVSYFSNTGQMKNCFESAARSCNIQITQSGIMHMVVMARMYNYIRMLRIDQTVFHYSPNHVGDYQPVQEAPPPPPPVMQQMQRLKIRHVVSLDEDCEDKEVDDDDHKCGVCFDNFTDINLVMTGCNHAFCADCIHGVARTRGLKSFIRCPSCRTDISELAISQHTYAAVVAGLAPV